MKWMSIRKQKNSSANPRRWKPSAPSQVASHMISTTSSRRILGFTEMAIEDVADRPDVGRSLQNVLKSAMRAKDLVKQILAFSRKTNYERAPLSLSPLVKETVQLLRASIPRTIEIRLDITTSWDHVLAAPVEVHQILMNLATNASLAMQEKGGILEVSLCGYRLHTGVARIGTGCHAGRVCTTYRQRYG